MKRNVRKFNGMAAGTMPVFLPTDLDRGRCPARLRREWLPDSPADGRLFRVAVREVESWLLADRDALAGFLGITVDLVPRNPDRIADPKTAFLGLTKRSRDRILREEILPAPGAVSPAGLGYGSRFSRFVERNGRAERAAFHSPSWNRAWKRVRELGG